jgi:flagellar biosynthesis protein FlhF
MKVRRYFAPDMRSALAAARREQGADVMIVGQRRVDGGLELLTAEGDEAEVMRVFAPAGAASRASADSDTDEAAIVTIASKHTDATPPASPHKAPVASATNLAGAKRRVAPQVSAQVPATAIKAPKRPEQSTGTRAGTRVKQQGSPATNGAPAKASVAHSQTLWTHEPVIEQMHNELRSMRGLLQQQTAAQAWNALRQRHPMAAHLLRRSVSVGVAPRLAQGLVQIVPGSLSFDQGWEKFHHLFAQRLRVTGDELLERGGAAVLLGPTGAGKTTLACKLAAQFALRHGKGSVALVTADSQRIAAHEQLRSFGRIMGMPVRVIAGVEQLRPAIEEVYDHRLVLVDTAGMSHRDRRLDATFAAIRDCAPLVRPYLVASAATQARDLNAIFARYAPVSPAAVTLTKLDEASYLAPALSAAIVHQLAVAYVSAGQSIPEDCEVASAERLVARALGTAAAEGHL